MPPIRITPCGHNFCEKCLIEISRGKEQWSCAECRKIHNCQIDTLVRAYLIEKCVEKLKKKQVEQSILMPRNEFGTCEKHNRAIEISKLSGPISEKFIDKYKIPNVFVYLKCSHVRMSGACK